MQYEQYNNKNTHIIYDPALIPDCPEALFCDESSRRLERGCARFFDYRGMALVHKRYRRGGLLGRFIHDTYRYRRLGYTRMWSEFQLLGELCEMGLPVPQPVAARCQRTAGLLYRGDLVTCRIPDTRTLSEQLEETELDRQAWHAIGAMIARFHKNQVYHSDLNAHNILIDHGNRIFLIDFDKGAIRNGEQWKATNLGRLHRSLSKLLHQRSRFHFTGKDWEALISGYEEAGAGTR